MVPMSGNKGRIIHLACRSGRYIPASSWRCGYLLGSWCTSFKIFRSWASRSAVGASFYIYAYMNTFSAKLDSIREVTASSKKIVLVSCWLHPNFPQTDVNPYYIGFEMYCQRAFVQKAHRHNSIALWISPVSSGPDTYTLIEKVKG